MEHEQQQHLIGALAGVVIALALAVIALILTDPQAWTQALTTNSLEYL